MDLFNLITPNTTLLTPNRRLAATLLNQFNQLQIDQRKTCWESLDILPLPSWLQRLWKTFLAKEMMQIPLLLTANQKSIVWEMILRESSVSDALLQLSETAKLAESADELLKLWEIKLNDPTLTSTEDSQVFQEWAIAFQTLCEKNNWIDHASLVAFFKKNNVLEKIILPQKIILVGFTEIAPLHMNLLNAFKELGTQIIYYNAKTKAKSIQKIGLLDEETEIRTMARWAKATYDTMSHKKPYSIGCVVPNLETLRESVLQIFSDTFSKENTFTLDHTVLPFNITAGKNLLSFPMIRTAILLLNLAKKNISLESLIYLLRSPFLGDAEKEKLKRSYFENRLKNSNVTTLSIRQLIFPDSSYHLASCPALLKRFQNFLNHFDQIKKKLSMQEWAHHFVELLKILGWPGERSLNSQEYQITQRWLDLLLEVSHLDSILEPQTFFESIEWLTQLSAKTIFQPQSPEAPIQILGVLEAAELPFEHLWVMGFDDTNWPPAPKPNPLIPQRLQKMLNMPHATTERELIYSEQLIKQLQNSAKQVIFSYPEKNGDIQLRASALIHPIESIQLKELSLSHFTTVANKIFESSQLENFMDDTAPPIQDNEKIYGGTSIFKQQAACPFKAFAELRLHAKFVDTPTLGLRAIDRGNIVHKTLELLWKKLKDSTTLIAMPHDELKKIIRDCSEEAIKQNVVDASNQRYLSLELERLEKIVWDWLKLESQRPPFTVAFQEHEMNATMGHLPIKIRVDRIDELADGSHLIIDYKTGKNNDIKKWFGERLDEPQLPLYCLVGFDNISGIAFGQLHPDEMSLLGISKKNLNMKSIKTLAEISYGEATLWDQQLLNWKTTLENLSRDFLNGVAFVDPKDINQVCSHCKLQTLCRVHEK